MTTVLCSETRSRLSKALAERLAAREVEVATSTGKKARVPGDCAALVITDLAPALMVRPMPAQEGAEPLKPEAVARIEALIDAAARAEVRIVLLSTPLPGPGTPETGLTRQARWLESCIAEQAADGSVILRARDIVDPADEALRKTIQALIDGSQAVWPQEELVQPIALSDLAAALEAATHTKRILGSWYDIVHPEAVARTTLQAEAQRLARVLTDPDTTEIQIRPDYPPVEPLRDGAPGATALHVTPAKSMHVLLAETIQGLVRDAVAAGKTAPIRPPMPAVHRALETGGLPLAGAQVVLTGATGSIGRAAARMLVRLGAHVTGIARDKAKGEALACELAEARPFLSRQRNRLDRERAARDGNDPIPGEVGDFRFLAVDLADLDAVRALAKRLEKELTRVDALVHLAGAAHRERKETPQGIESTLAIDLVSPLALTRLLADPLRAAGQDGGAWVLTVVAENQAEFPFDLDDLQSRNAFIPAEVLAHAQSGLVAMTGALAEVMRGSGVKTAAVSLAPVRTDFLTPLEEPITGGATAQQVQQTQREQKRMQMDTPAHAASEVLDLLVSADFAPAHGGLVHGGELVSSALATQEDRDRVAALWKTCAEMAGLPE